jgi:hypothetical protein
MKRINALIILFTITMMTCTTASSASSVNTIEAQPYEMNIEKGTEFEIKLFVSLIEDINALAVNITNWNPILAKCIEILPGDIFPNHIVWINGKRINNENGIIEHIVFSQQTPVNSGGHFATIKFLALNDGTFKLNIPPGQFDAANAGIRAQTGILSYSIEIDQETKKADSSKESFLGLSEVVIFGIFGAMLSLILILFYVKKKDSLLNGNIDEKSEMVEKKDNLVKVIRNEKNRN